MKTLMIDMDNVLTNGNFDKYIEQFYNMKVNLDETTAYAYVQEYTKEKTSEFWEYIKDKDFYADAPLLDGAYEVIEKLNKKYDVYIVTSYIWRETIDLSSKCLKDKYEYLKKQLPFIDPSKYIFTTNKEVMNFDIRIDDKIENLSGAETKILFSAWHNKNISEEELQNNNILRANDWHEIREVLEKIV